MLFSGLEKHFASGSSRCWSNLERRQSHVMSKATITIDDYKAFGLTKSPFFGAACVTADLDPPRIWTPLRVL